MSGCGYHASMAYQREFMVQLRVYEPTDVHGSVKATGVTDRNQVEQMVFADADIRLISLPPDPIASKYRDTPLVLTGAEVGDGVDRICPVQDDVRSWLALDELNSHFTRTQLDLIAPRAARRRAQARRVVWMNSGADERVYTKTSAWEVSPIWWVAIDPETDVIVQEDAPDGARRVRIRAELLTASARVEWALDIMRKKSAVDGIIHTTSDFLEWLDSFDMGSILELDLGGMSDVLWPDTGAKAVMDWLDALDSDDEEAAAIAFADYTEKWERTTLFARSS